MYEKTILRDQAGQHRVQKGPGSQGQTRGIWLSIAAILAQKFLVFDYSFKFFQHSCGNSNTSLVDWTLETEGELHLPRFQIRNEAQLYDIAGSRRRPATDDNSDLSGLVLESRAPLAVIPAWRRTRRIAFACRGTCLPATSLC